MVFRLSITVHTIFKELFILHSQETGPRRIIGLCTALFQMVSLMSGKPLDVFFPIFTFQAHKIYPYNVRTYLFKEKWLNTETPTEEHHEYFCGEYKLLFFLICSPSSKHWVTISCCIATSLEGIYFFLHTFMLQRCYYHLCKMAH